MSDPFHDPVAYLPSFVHDLAGVRLQLYNVKLTRDTGFLTRVEHVFVTDLAVVFRGRRCRSLSLSTLYDLLDLGLAQCDDII